MADGTCGAQEHPPVGYSTRPLVIGKLTLNVEGARPHLRPKRRDGFLPIPIKSGAHVEYLHITTWASLAATTLTTGNLCHMDKASCY